MKKKQPPAPPETLEVRTSKLLAKQGFRCANCNGAPTPERRPMAINETAGEVWCRQCNEKGE